MDAIDKDKLENAKAKTLKRFRHSDLSHEAVREVFRLCVLREVKSAEHRVGKGKDRSASRKQKIESRDPVVKTTIDPQELIGKQLQLPSLPQVFSRIVELMSNSISSADDFADVIMKDPALSARLLKIVNSAFYGFRAEIATISQAVTIIGTKDLYALCLGTSVLRTFKNIPIDLVDMPSFWTHSIACGLIARLIAEETKQTDKERFFVAGLLHDIGRLIILHHLPTQSKSILNQAESQKLLLFQSETDIIGFDHGKIGGILLRKWKLPSDLDNMVRFHHEPADSRYPAETAIVHLANILANAFNLGTSGEIFVPPLAPSAWRDIGLSVKQIAQIAAQADTQLPEIMTILFPEASQ